MKKYIIVLFCAIFSFNFTPTPNYKDASLPIEQRLDDLINRMTLQEKVGQLMPFMVRDSIAFDDNGNFIGVIDTATLNRGVGTFFSQELRSETSNVKRARCINGIQRYLVEHTRLGIPAFFFSESLHGLMAAGATSFPQAIALGSTWDTTLVEQIFTVAAREGYARGTRQVLSPVLDLARDPRWGRFDECYSEDPYLASRIGMAAVFGLQGRDKTIGKDHLVVTLKHFAGHGESEGGRNLAPVNHPERYFHETHLYPFEMAIKRANAQSVMASYNEWDGVPNHVNHKLLTEILRDEWGFTGYVMSDGGGMDVTYQHHLAAANPAESGAMSIRAGLDYDLGSRGGCFRTLLDELAKGTISEDNITRAAKNVLRVKLRCGLFERPYIDPEAFDKIANNAEHKSLALKAAHKALVLLKNENNTLPFDAAKISKLAVIGPNAPDIHLGGYSAVPMQGVSVLEGIQTFAKGKFDVVYSPGCRLTLNKECHWYLNENPILNDPEDDKKLIAEAVNVAKQSDAVVLVIGENELICREAWSETHLGDRDNLDLVGRQNELAKAILATGKPVAILLINGRPISINYLQAHAPAIIECWYLGQETGHAVANVIFGKVNPGGKLPVTFPRSVGQLPCYYDKKPTNHRDYVLADSSPLYPFGFGLSYTTFDYSNLQMFPTEITAASTSLVSVDITNTGKRAGDEIVQLYIHDIVSFPTRPVKELKDFRRITLQPGETQNVTFAITPEKLEAFDLTMKRVVQPGEFAIMVGTNSVDVLSDTLLVK
ncbi:glycoside hydrolase family 3 C-terminal domain-containing protein [candidate division KSB1 bacterium]|nr:glycoside hydrolase family 3 C-terminal domain-containing protein [candidate division KSB1 bacterium]